MIRKNPIGKRLLTLAAVAMVQLSLIGCGLIGQSRDVKLGVPYRAQDPSSMNCGPASVLMWRLFDGRPEISQSTIGAWMGGGTNCGYGEAQIAAAVRHFTSERVNDFETATVRI